MSNLTEPHVEKIFQAQKFAELDAKIVVPETTRTVTVASGFTMADLQVAIGSIGKYIPLGVTVTVDIPAGTPASGTLPLINNFYGGGKLVIQGASATLSILDGTGLTTKLSTDARWFINTLDVDVEIKNIEVVSSHVNAIRTSLVKRGLLFENCHLKTTGTGNGYVFNTEGFTYCGNLDFLDCRLDAATDYTMTLQGSPTMKVVGSALVGGNYNYRWYGSPQFRESGNIYTNLVATFLKSTAYIDEV